MQGLHEAGFEIVIVGHSLGAGAAALLALIFEEKQALRNALIEKCAPSVLSHHSASLEVQAAGNMLQERTQNFQNFFSFNASTIKPFRICAGGSTTRGYTDSGALLAWTRNWQSAVRGM